MKHASTPRRLSAVAVAVGAAAAALLLGACDRDRTVGQKIDGALSSTERKVEQAKVEVQKDMAEAKAATTRATEQLGQKIDRVADKVGNRVADAALTTSIKSELAKDTRLSAMRIDVDTSNGQVTLSGTAPDAQARDRATLLASAVKGVTGVDNRLRIGS